MALCDECVRCYESYVGVVVADADFCVRVTVHPPFSSSPHTIPPNPNIYHAMLNDCSSTFPQEFDDSRDAEDAIRDTDGKDFLGHRCGSLDSVVKAL